MPRTIRTFIIATFDPLTRSVSYIDPRDEAQHLWFPLTSVTKAEHAATIKSRFRRNMEGDGMDVLWNEDAPASAPLGTDKPNSQ